MATLNSNSNFDVAAAEGAKTALRYDRVSRECLFFALGLTAILAVFYWPFLTKQQSFYQADITFYFQPFTAFIVESYRHGQLPLWNPYLYAGMSQIAVPSPSPFYPPIALFLGMPFSQALASYMMLHQVVAGVGAFLLIASLGWGVLAATVCGLAIALCGYMFALGVNYTLVATIAWLPLLLFLLRRTNGSHSLSNVITMLGASTCMFTMVGAGRPEISVPAALIAGGYVCISFVTAWRSDRLLGPNLSAAGLRLLALFAGGLLTAPILLPALEWVRLSPRKHGLELQWVLMWSANWYDMLCMLLAQPLGDLTVLGSKYLNVAASRMNALPFLQSTYIGPIAFTFALWSMMDSNWRWRWWILAVFAGGLIMAAGNYTPIAPAICKLSPALAAFRYPVKLMIFPLLAVSFAAARGVFLASEKRVEPSAERLTIGLWATMAASGLACLFVPALAELTRHYLWLHPNEINLSFMQDVQHQFGKSYCIAAGLGAVINGLYVAYRKGKLNRRFFGAAVVTALVACLVYPSFHNLRHGGIGDFFQRPVALAEDVRPLLGMRSDGTASATTSIDAAPAFTTRSQSLLFDPLTPGLTFLSDHKVDFQVGFFLFARQAMLQNSNVDTKIPYAFGYEAAEVGSFKDLFTAALSMSSQNRQHDAKQYHGDAAMARFCQMTSVSTVTTQSFLHHPTNKNQMLDSQYFTLLKDNPNLNVRLYATKNCQPRAYFADNIVWQAKWKDFFHLMVDAKNKEPLRQTFVETGIEPGVDASSEHNDSEGRIAFLKDTNNSVSLRVNSTKKKLLVLTDHYYPGWVCRIDGKEVPIVRVNFFARGVFVPPGEHTIAYEYEPVSFRLGVFISLAVLAAYALFLCLAWRKKYHSSVPNTMSSRWVA